MRPKVIQKKKNIEMLQFAFLQLAKGLELETPVIDFISFGLPPNTSGWFI